MYNSIKALLRLAQEKPLPLVIIENEMLLSGEDEKAVRSRLAQRLEVMKASAQSALTRPLTMPAMLISGQAQRQHVFSQKQTLCGSEINHMLAMALSCSEANASMGRICAAPTAGACGIVPAVLLTVKAKLNSTDEEMIDALAVASGFGAIIMKNATVSGAEGGCQAECGTAAAMAAAAAVYLAKGTAEMCANAAAISLINCMGLICDPVAGLVQMPCSFRNASQSINALTSADMALAGQTSVVTPDEVIDAMYRTGKKLPSDLRETANGGIAATATAKKIENDLFDKIKKL